MGTAYVFNEQAFQEMLLKHARGDHALYRRYMAFHFFFFTLGCSLCATIAFALPDAGGFALAFYATAGFSVVVGVGFGAFFSWVGVEREVRTSTRTATVELSVDPSP